MIKEFNKAMVSGRLTDDPKYGEGQGEGSRSWARFTLAVDRTGNIKEGGQTADFLSIAAFGPNADFVKKYLTKGRRVGVEGRNASGSYARQDGQRVYEQYIIAEEFTFMDSKPQNSAAPTSAPAAAPMPAPQPAPQAYAPQPAPQAYAAAPAPAPQAQAYAPQPQAQAYAAPAQEAYQQPQPQAAAPVNAGIPDLPF